MSSKTITALLISITLLLLCCNGNRATPLKRQAPVTIAQQKANPEKVSGIMLPPGFTRKEVAHSSFSFWLQNIKIKKDNTVYLYNGTKKINQQAQFAVLDIPVGKENLQQCADATIRLRAEYLFSINNYSEINFTDNEGTIYQFTQPYTPAHLAKYLKKVFGMCGTASLNKQMKTIRMEDMKPGDVLIRGGFPGHAVIVMDMAENNKGEKIYMLAQSYMPAQDIHILKNPANPDENPWYKINSDELIETPEYIFKRSELKRW